MVLFQSAHPHGVRFNLILTASNGRLSFNPRTRMGCDYNSFLRPYSSSRVSIRAPAWGAMYMEVELPFVALFQSAHPHGVRFKIDIRLLKTLTFQSAHPHGVRFFIGKV